jgi:hypothetical protein
MLHHYEDIRSRIAEPPKWWDESGVPRWCEFGPGETANIYRSEVALLLIACQGCGQEFKVAMSATYGRELVDGTWCDEPLANAVRKLEIHYGDPPNVDCCAAGPSMNSEPQRVLEFWGRDDGHDLVRRPELEIDIDDEAARDARVQLMVDAMDRVGRDRAEEPPDA